MYKTTKRLQKDCMRACVFEILRKKLVENGKYSLALATYKSQKYFLPDFNSGLFWDEKFAFDRMLNPMEKWRTKRVISLVKSNSQLLNLGVGSGRLEELLFNSKGINYVGTDITHSTLKLLRKRYPDKLFLTQSLPLLNFKNSEFDQVLLLEVLEHIKPSETLILLREIYRILNNRGEFIVSIPINEGLERMLPENQNSHMRMYSEKLLLFELRAVGFKVQKIFRCTAFNKMFSIKHFLNLIFPFRHANNLVILCSKK